MLRIVACMLLHVGMAKCDKETLWRATNDVSEDSRFLNSTVQSISATSDMICAIKAARIPWALLFCFKDGACQASDLAVSPLPDDEIQTPNAVCYTVVGHERKNNAENIDV